MMCRHCGKEGGHAAGCTRLEDAAAARAVRICKTCGVRGGHAIDCKVVKKKKPKKSSYARRPPDLLADMRHVYSNSEGHDITEGEKRCRKWLLADLKGFLAQLSALEKNQPVKQPVQKIDTPVASKAADPAPEVEVIEDAGAERAVEILDRLIKEFQETQR